jgi:hypothetical protein
MTDPQQVIDESRPMLEEFLSDVGIYQPGQPIADPQLLERFSNWLAVAVYSTCVRASRVRRRGRSTALR